MLIVILALVISVNSMPTRVNDVNTAMDHLKQFGHMAENATDDRSLRESLIKYQTFMGLNATGVLDKSTIDLMSKPRCGMLDTSSEPSVLPKPSKETTVTYAIMEYPQKKPKIHYDDEIKEAFDKWSEHTYFRFVPQRRREDILIVFKRRRHADFQPFDGPGGVAGHARASEMVIHFDSDEDWSEDETGTNLQLVAAHEVGHILGLSHSNNPEAVMYSILTNKGDFRLHSDDIERVQRMYNITPKTSSTNISQNIVNREIKIEPKDFDTIFKMNDGTIYAFHYKNYIEYDSSFKEIKRGLIEEKWKFLPDHIDTALQHKTGAMFFFKGNNYWMYNGTEVNPGSPLMIFNGFPGITNTSAAILWRQNLYFFFYNVFMIHKNYVDVIKETPISYFHGAPSSVRGAIAVDDNSIYFFRRNSYYIYDAVSNSTRKDRICNLLKC